MKKIVLAAAAFLALAAPAASQQPQQGGPVAVGQAMAQADQQGKVAIIQAPTPPPASGGLIQLSAFGWLAPYVDSALQALIVLGMGILGKSKYSQWLDQSGRDALETFLKNRAASMVADGGVWMQGKAVHVDNDLLFRAATQASVAIPDALKRFKLTPEVMAAKIVDAIPQTQAGAAIIATAHAESEVQPEPVKDRPAPPALAAIAPAASAKFLPPTAAA